MKTNYLFPASCKRVGWWLFIPSAIAGLAVLFTEYSPEILTFKVPAFFVDELFGKSRFFAWVENNILNEILGVLFIVGGILVAFSKEKTEDEYIANIRLKSLVWAVYVNYAILLLSFLFVFDISFLWVMIFNMFTVLVFFIVRFNWQLAKFKKGSYDE